MPLSVGASPDDVERLTGMLRAVGQFGHRLGRICDDCVQALVELAASPAGEDFDDDTSAQQRADDDGWPPSD
jgi:hypothetical protein